jgi:alkanesulfonate monooxygenase SsuD/methylene tetrahydromethanopterin reductase-like flavin-dependent oxidoreductase (luciferase family)
MRFGIFTTLYDCGGGATSPAEVLDNVREQALLAEQLGYDAVWMGEHHFGPYDLGDIPNPILVGADLAARTTRLRIGQMANIAVWWHPIRLAEDIAILDNLSKGRVEVGFGRGVWPYEGPQFHPHANPAKDKENRELFRETIDIVKKVWTENRFSHQGPNYTFPAAETTFTHPQFPPDPEWQDGSRVLKLRVTPKPYQKPHPPLWMTVSTDRSVSFAAELGLRACYWQPPARRVRQRMELYAEIRSRLEGRLVSPSAGQAVLRHTYVAPTMEAARREAEEGILSAFIYNDPFRGREVFTNPGEELAPGTKLDWQFLEPRNLLVGPPEHVVERVAELQEVCGLEYLLVGYAHPGVPQRLILRNLELFATKVMPAFQGVAQ